MTLLYILVGCLILIDICFVGLGVAGTVLLVLSKVHDRSHLRTPGIICVTVAGFGLLHKAATLLRKFLRGNRVGSATPIPPRPRPPPKRLSLYLKYVQLPRKAPCFKCKNKNEALARLRTRIKNETEPVDLEDFEDMEFEELRRVIVVGDHGYRAENIYRMARNKHGKSPLNPNYHIRPSEYLLSRYLLRA